MAGAKKIPFTPEQIAQMRRMYLEEGLSLSKIAKHFECSTVVIRNRLDASVPVVKHIAPPMSAEEIQKELGITKKEIKQVRKIIGVNI